MKTVIVHKESGNISKDNLFYEGIEMAKKEVAANLWYNMNIKRIKGLVTFCMEYLQYQDAGKPSEKILSEDSSSTTLRYYN